MIRTTALHVLFLMFFQQKTTHLPIERQILIFMAYFVRIFLSCNSHLYHRHVFLVFVNFNSPMADSKSAQSWYFFSIIEISNFLGFQNVFPKLHEPSWFWNFFVFSWNSLFFCASLHATDFEKKWCKTKWPCFS